MITLPDGRYANFTYDSLGHVLTATNFHKAVADGNGNNVDRVITTTVDYEYPAIAPWGGPRMSTATICLRSLSDLHL